MILCTRRLAARPTLRAANDPTRPARLVGYAARYGTESEPLVDPDVNEGKPFVEILARGCFDRTLVERPDVRALFNHDTSHVLARTKNGTLKLKADAVGLAFDMSLPDTGAGRDVRALVGGGYIDGCSFGFLPVRAELRRRPGALAVRTVFDLDLYEISPAVAFPAYQETDVELRKLGRPSTAPAPDVRASRLALLWS